MNNSVTLFMCALFLLLFAVVGYMLASGWVRTIWQQVRIRQRLLRTVQSG